MSIKSIGISLPSHDKHSFIYSIYAYKKLITKILKHYIPTKLIGPYAIERIIYKYTMSFNIKIFAVILFDIPSLGTKRYFATTCTHIYYVHWTNSLCLYSDSYNRSPPECKLRLKYIF